MSPAAWICIGLTMTLLQAATASAGGSHAYGDGDPVWKDECGACHVAYPVQLLSASQWRAVMAGLDRHFGVNASLDAQTARHLSAYLQARAGRADARDAADLTRITQTRWFRREHDELAPEVWKRPDVKSPANCAACHMQAEAGDYSKRTRRVPR